MAIEAAARATTSAMPCRNGKIASGKGAQALRRVPTIAVDVEHVIDEVCDRCHQAEAEECSNGCCNRGFGEIVRQQQRGKQENVFCPLVHADGLDEHAERGSSVNKGAGHRDIPVANRDAEARCGVGEHGHAGLAQHGQVGPGVADVVKLAELVLEACELLFPGKVGSPIGGENAFKYAQMRRDALRQAAISAGSEKDLPAYATLGLKKSKQLYVVGQAGGIERGVLRHFKLEAGAALHQPEGDAPELERPAAGEEAESV